MHKNLDDINRDHKKKWCATSANKHASDHDDIVDVLLKLQELGELEFNLTSNRIKAVTLVSR